MLSTPTADAPEAAPLRLMRSTIGLLRGRPMEALHEADAARQTRGLPDELFGAANACRLTALTALHDLSHARELAEAMLAGREGPGGDEALASAVNEIGLLAWEDGRLSDALGLLTAAAHRSPTGAGGLGGGHPSLNVSPVLVAAGDFVGARAALEDANRQLHPSKYKIWAPGLAILAARIHLATGSLDAAVGQAEYALELAERLGANIFVPRAAWVLASVALLRGDVDEAAVRASAYRTGTSSGYSGWSTGLFRWADSRLALARGRSDAAMGFLADVVDQPDAYRPLFLEEPASAPWLVRAALALGQPGRAEVVVSCTDRLAAANADYPSVRALAEHARGLLERDVHALVHAAGAHTQPWARATAHEDAATVLEDNGARGASGGQQRKSLAAYHHAGAEWDASRVARRIAGVDDRRGLRRARGSGWAALTGTEHRVAHLVAEGLSNPEVGHRMVMSRHTVDFHLRQIFRKLDIGSRVALARIVGERASRPPRPRF